MKGLRESSTMDMETSKVHVHDDSLSSHFCDWKGRRASAEHLISYHRVTAGVSSPLDMFKRGILSRDRHARFFATDYGPEKYQKYSFTRALTRFLDTLGLSAPPNGMYTCYCVTAAEQLQIVRIHVLYSNPSGSSVSGQF